MRARTENNEWREKSTRLTPPPPHPTFSSDLTESSLTGAALSLTAALSIILLLLMVKKRGVRRKRSLGLLAFNLATPRSRALTPAHPRIHAYSISHPFRN